jgi:Tetratricopeptide repeat
MGREITMWPNLCKAALLSALTWMNSPGRAVAQSSANPASTTSRESAQDLLAKLNPQQKQQFEQAGKSFGARQYADALAAYKHLLADLPGDVVLSKFASEAALNAGDTAFALNVLKPIAQADLDDWQAVALLTRACAESGDAACRDSGIAHMLDLHNRGITPLGMRQYIVEQVKAGENNLLIWTSVEPWGYYKIYAMGQVINPQGKLFLRATLESNDSDQALFAKEHPDEASKGFRSFSLDSYLDTGTNSNGQRTQTHATYKFFVGQPSYATIREEFIKIASGKGAPLSTRDNLIVP